MGLLGLLLPPRPAAQAAAQATRHAVLTAETKGRQDDALLERLNRRTEEVRRLASAAR